MRILRSMSALLWLGGLIGACGTEVERVAGEQCAVQLLVHTPPGHDAFGGLSEFQVQLLRPDAAPVVRRISPDATEFVLAASPVEGARILLEGLDAAGEVVASGRSLAFDLAPETTAEVHLLFARRGEFVRLRGSLGAARFGHSLTALLDGRVLVMGGASEGSPEAPVGLAPPELYDPLQQSSCGGQAQACPRFAGGDLRYGHSADLSEQGKVIVFGGRDSGGALESSVLVFEPEAGAFRLLQNLDPAKVTPRAHHASSTVRVMDEQSGSFRESLLIAGGEIDGQAGPEAISSALLFDTRAEIFTRTDLSLEQARTRARATAFGPEQDRVLVTGGIGAAGLVDAVELFYGGGLIPWVVEGSGAAEALHLARRDHVALAFDEGVLILGGDDGSHSLDAPEIFFYGGELGTGIFSLGVAAAPPDHVGRRGQVAVALQSGGVLLAGGEKLESGQRILSDAVELLQRPAGSQQVRYLERAPLSAPRSMAAWCVLPSGGILLSGGLVEGSGGPVASAEVWYYNP